MRHLIATALLVVMFTTASISQDWVFEETPTLQVSKDLNGYFPDSVEFFADGDRFGISYYNAGEDNYSTFFSNPIESGVYFVEANLHYKDNIVSAESMHMTYQVQEDTLGRVFTTEGRLPELVILQEPEHEATDVSVNVLLIWEETGFADHYQLQVVLGDARIDPELFNNPIIDEIVNATEYQLHDLEYETTYSWRVRAGNHVGWGSWSGNF